MRIFAIMACLFTDEFTKTSLISSSSVKLVTVREPLTIETLLKWLMLLQVHLDIRSSLGGQIH